MIECSWPRSIIKFGSRTTINDKALGFKYVRWPGSPTPVHVLSSIVHGPCPMGLGAYGDAPCTDVLHRSGSVDRPVVRVYLGRRGAMNGL
jgi:hypothetical protein